MKVIEIGNTKIGENYPTFIVAEISGNHNGSLEKAMKLIEEAKKAGVDGIKLQTYLPSTITLDCDNEFFNINQDSIWHGENLYNLYEKAHTPWEWQPKLKEYAESLGLVCFSSPFDKTSVDFLENLKVPAYKIASFEITDIPLIEYIAEKNRPIILSTGIATLGEIEEAIKVIKSKNNHQIIILKCTSAYSSKPEEINLKSINSLQKSFGVTVGLSDHTLGIEVPIAAVTLGAKVVEKHIILSRTDGGVDSEFSLEPDEFKVMVYGIRNVEKALGQEEYILSKRAEESREFARSLFISEDIKKGEVFNEKNIKSVRPSYGLHPRYYNYILGKNSKKDLKKGTPLKLEYID